MEIKGKQNKSFRQAEKKSNFRKSRIFGRKQRKSQMKSVPLKKLSTCLMDDAQWCVFQNRFDVDTMLRLRGLAGREIKGYTHYYTIFSWQVSWLSSQVRSQWVSFIKIQKGKGSWTPACFASAARSRAHDSEACCRSVRARRDIGMIHWDNEA